MKDFPSNTLAIYGSDGALFAHVRIAADPDRPERFQCIIDAPGDLPSDGGARWFAKRHYQRWSEHSFKVAKDGAITVHQGDFKAVFEPREEGGGFDTRAPAPPLFADWV